MPWQNIRRVRPEVWTKVISRCCLTEFIHVIDDLLLANTPCEISIRLIETNLSQRCHHFRFGKGFGEENGIRILLLNFGYRPLPKWNGFRMRIIDTENRYTGFNPEDDNRF